MADATHLYLVIGGGYTDETVEHWQTGIRFLFAHDTLSVDDVGAFTPRPVLAATDTSTGTHWTLASTFRIGAGLDEFRPDNWFTDQVIPAVIAHWGARISSKARVDYLKASPINASGHVVEGRTCLATWFENHPVGDATAAPLPIETSIATSWKTPRIGRRGRGRIYPPYSSTAELDGSGNVNTTAASAIRDANIAMLEGMAFLAPLGVGFTILPVVTGAPWTDYGVINQVNVGSVFDVQRRRRRQLPEVRVSGSVTYA